MPFNNFFSKLKKINPKDRLKSCITSLKRHLALRITETLFLPNRDLDNGNPQIYHSWYKDYFEMKANEAQEI